MMQTNKKKKSKRTYTSREDQLQAEKVEEFSRLDYNARKLIRKEAKLVKAFECKKINKKIKPLKDEVSIANNQDTKSKQKLEKLEFKLKATKDFDLEQLVDVCMQRLGINQLKPHNKDETQPHHKKEQQPNTASFDSATNDYHQTLIESILQHKKIISALDEIDKKVVTYRNWVVGREKRMRSEHTDSEFHKGQKKSKKRKLNKEQSQIMSVNDDISTLFVNSLSGAIPDEMDDDDGANGYADDFELDIPKKKNRKGQRARKAKAMAIEAKKAGRLWDSSINWRPKKSKDDQNNSQETDANQSSASGLHNKTEVKIADVVDMGKSWKEEGKAHPSWAAREAQKAKAGIAQFAGKKITFDD